MTDYILIGDGVVSASGGIVGTPGGVLKGDNSTWPSVIAGYITDNINSGATNFPGHPYPTPVLKNSDNIYFAIFNDGAYHVYLNPNSNTTADTLNSPFNDPQYKTLAKTYKYYKAPTPVLPPPPPPDVVSADLPSDVPVDSGSNNMMMYLIIVVVLLVLGGGAFFVFGKKKGSTNSQSFGRMISRISRMGRSIRKM
jgi:hypothetical protein